METINHYIYSGKIRCFSKMFLHNRADLVNFDQTFGLVVLMETSQKTFPLNY